MLVTSITANYHFPFTAMFLASVWFQFKPSIVMILVLFILWYQLDTLQKPKIVYVTIYSYLLYKATCMHIMNCCICFNLATR